MAQIKENDLVLFTFDKANLNPYYTKYVKTIGLKDNETLKVEIVHKDGQLEFGDGLEGFPFPASWFQKIE